MNSTIATTINQQQHHLLAQTTTTTTTNININDDPTSAVATPLMQFAYTTWEAVEFVQVAHDTVTSGWWGSAYPEGDITSNDELHDDSAMNPNNNRGEVITIPAGHGSRLQSSSDIAESLPASFIQHRQLITTIGEITVSKLREVAIIVRTDDNASGLMESENALLGLVESSMDALAHICEIATLPLHESKGANAVAASVCVEAAKGVLNIVSELSFLSGADFSVAQREAAASQRNQLLAPHVVSLSTLMRNLISELTQPSKDADDSHQTPPTAFFTSFISRFERIISAIREIDSISPNTSGGRGDSSTTGNVAVGNAPRLGRIIIDVASQVVRHIRALHRSN